MTPAETPPVPVNIPALVRRSRSSFYWGMRILRPDRRAAMYALYAFCRTLDDIADGAQPLADRRAALGFWREEVARLSGNLPTHPVGRALADAVAQFGCDIRELALIIDGVESDLDRPALAPDWASLRAYCRQVAGAVGVVSVAIFGDSAPAARQFALELGEALQLTNILRDVHEDAAMGRIYLPREALIQAGIPPEITPALLVQHPCLRLACRSVATAAHQRFAAARQSLAHCDRRQMGAARLMMDSYERLFRLMERDGLPPRLRPQLGLLPRLWLLGRYLPQALYPA